MAKIKLLALTACTGGMLLFGSCGSKTYLSTYAPEESSLNVVKITDESKNTVLGPGVDSGTYNFVTSMMVGCNKKGLTWGSSKCLSVSPDGTEIAYLTRSNKQDNIMIRKIIGGGAATQRTFRNVDGFSWGDDGNLYFSDTNDSQNKICVMNDHAGSLMRQLTSNNWDYDPILSKDGKTVFFTRYESKGGPAIWSYNLDNGELTNCARGNQVELVDGSSDEFLCVRNNDQGVSEIWRVNFRNGQETLLLSDKERGYSNPTISPDGQWLLVVGNTVSSINKKKNLDLFVCKLDGSNMMQLTYHPGMDACPQWSADGRSIYFISNRATKDEAYNIWRISFNPYNYSYK
jgi:Tol biopolymer transport system component